MTSAAEAVILKTGRGLPELTATQFLSRFVRREDIIRAVAWSDETLSPPAAEALGVSVRTIQRWAQRERSEGHECAAPRCPVRIHADRDWCRWHEAGNPVGENVVGHLYPEPDESLEVPRWILETP